jgi:acetyl esterase/lipase
MPCNAVAPWRRLALLAPLAGLASACSPTRLAGALTPRAGTTLREGLAYGAVPRQRLDLYLPATVRPETPLLVFFYGGGWESGARGMYGFIARVLAARGMVVAVPDYRLWPETRWPGFIEDAAAAVAWLEGSAGRAAGVPARAPVVLMGHSAGGFLAGALALDPRWLGAARRAALAGCVTLAAPFDFVPRRQPLIAIFADAPDGAIRAVPAEAALLADAPPMLLLHGEADRTVRPEQSQRIAARLDAAGARDVRLLLFPGVGHIGILSALALPVRALSLAGAPVLEAVTGFVGAVAARAGSRAGGA